jgi:hypothetical protein
MAVVRVLKALGYVLTLRCEEADRLRAAKKRGEWTRAERIGEALHTSICKSCRNARRKLELLQESLEELEEEVAAEAMPKDVRERLRRRISE